jgi:hypothetical protein
MNDVYNAVLKIAKESVKNREKNQSKCIIL